jgi:hypothetical protein
LEAIVQSGPLEEFIDISLTTRTLVQEVSEVGIVTRDNRLGAIEEELEEKIGTWNWKSNKKPEMADEQLQLFP